MSFASFSVRITTLHARGFHPYTWRLRECPYPFPAWRQTRGAPPHRAALNRAMVVSCALSMVRHLEMLRLCAFVPRMPASRGSIAEMSGDVNALDVPLKSAAYLGPVIEHEVVTAAGDLLVVSSASAQATPRVEPGQRLSLIWRAKDCFALVQRRSAIGAPENRHWSGANSGFIGLS